MIDDENTEMPEETSSTGENVSDGEENSLKSATGEEKKSGDSSISADLIRGHINTIILRALYERDKYGYEIMNDIDEKSHGQYSLKQPTLYSALKRLENQGYIKAYWKTDEVSSGGRRKYFTLTESGKEMTEKNLAEWEYSRTIIDSLISDKSFDFSRPAPTPVDFTILRDSVSRVPIVRSDEKGREEHLSESETPTAVPVIQTENVTVDRTETIVSEQSVSENVTVTRAEQAQQPTQEVAPAPTAAEQLQQQATQSQTVINTYEQVQQPAQSQTVTTVYEQAQPAPRELTEEERARIQAHENYLRLISEPVKPTVNKPEEDIVPNSENVNSDKLLYNNKPETERDYKNLINGIFNRAVSNGSVQTTYSRNDLRQPSVSPVRAEDVRRTEITARGRADGVRIASSPSEEIDASYATKTTYNKGMTLFKCSAIVLGIIAVEFIFSFIFLSQLNTTWVYPVVILLLGLIQFGVFGALALKGYGSHCVRPTTHNYLSTCIIMTVILILIISALSFLLNMNPNSASDVVKMIIIPSITALNITVFAASFRLFLNK